MPKFKVCIKQTQTHSELVDIEADSPQAAEKLALDMTDELEFRDLDDTDYSAAVVSTSCESLKS